MSNNSLNNSISEEDLSDPNDFYKKLCKEGPLPSKLLKDLMEPLIERYWSSTAARLKYMVKLEQISKSENASNVWKVFDKSLNQFHALKKIKLKYHHYNQREYEKTLNEEIKHLIKILGADKSSLLQVHLISFNEDATICYIVTELLKGTLEEFTDYRRFEAICWTEEEYKFILFKLVKQVKKLRKLKIYHRDIKPSNIIIDDKENSVKLTDFGCACEANPGPQDLRIAGSLSYMAPELLKMIRENKNPGRYDPYVTDLFSIGTTMVKITGSEPERDGQTGYLDLDMTDFLLSLAKYLKGLNGKGDVRAATAEEILENIEMDEWPKNDEGDSANEAKSAFEFKRFLFQRTMHILEKKGKHIDTALCFEIFDAREAVEMIKSQIEKEKLKVAPNQQTEWKVLLVEAYLRNKQYEEGFQKAKKLLSSDEFEPSNTKSVLLKANLFIVLGKMMLELNKTKVAIDYFGNALKLKKGIIGEINKEIAEIFIWIAKAFAQEKKFIQATNAFNKALDIDRMSSKARPNQLTINIYMSLGEVWEQEGRLEDAIESFSKAQDLGLQIYNETHPVIADQYLQKGKIYIKLNKISEAGENFEKCIDISKAYHGDQSLSIASIYFQIACCYEEREMVQEATGYLMEARSMYESIESPNREKASVYSLSGGLLARKGLYEIARDEFLEAIKIKESYYGKDHPQLIFDYIMCAQLQEILNKEDGEETNIKQIKSIDLNLYEPNRDLVICFLKVASIMLDMKEVKESNKYAQKALEIARKDFSDDVQFEIKSLELLALIDCKEKEYDKGIEKLKIVLDLQSKINNEESYQSSFTLYYLGKMYRKLANYEEAMQQYEKSLAILKNRFGEEFYLLGDILMDVSRLHETQGNNKKAVEVAKEACEIYEKGFEEDNPRIVKCKEKIQQLEDILSKNSL